jgi:hypothetical protein
LFNIVNCRNLRLIYIVSFIKYFNMIVIIPQIWFVVRITKSLFLSNIHLNLIRFVGAYVAEWLRSLT